MFSIPTINFLYGATDTVSDLLRLHSRNVPVTGYNCELFSLRKSSAKNASKLAVSNLPVSCKTDMAREQKLLKILEALCAKFSFVSIVVQISYQYRKII